jgi:hypothetical protein
MWSLTYMPDCMGYADPTPADGYPGCLGGFGKRTNAIGEYCKTSGNNCCNPDNNCEPVDPTDCDGCAGTVEAPWLGSWFEVTRGCFNIMDIVPPAGQAVQVGPGGWDLGDTYALEYNEAADNWDEADGAEADDGWHYSDLNASSPLANCTEKPEKQCYINHSNYFASYYDKGPSHCRIWFSYGDWYASAGSDDPWLWYSACDRDTPNPQGAFDFGDEDGGNWDPNHTLKQYMILADIPYDRSITYFGGETMLFGGHRNSGGGNGSSAGPTMHLRPWTIPTPDGGGHVQDHTDVLWYRWHGSYWWQARDLDVDVNTDSATWYNTRWDIKADQQWSQYVSVLVDGQPSDAYVVMWHRPTIDIDAYPHNQTPPFEYDGTDPDLPPYQDYPVCWYGYDNCAPKGTFNYSNAPTYRETRLNTTTKIQCDPALFDPGGDCEGLECKDCADGILESDVCNTAGWASHPISWDSGSGKGWHCNDQTMFLLFYDPADLEKAYDGTINPWEVMPYAEDYADWWTGGKQSGQSAYDRTNQRIYIPEYNATDGYVHILDMGEGGDPEPPPAGDGLSKIEGGSPGGKVE